MQDRFKFNAIVSSYYDIDTPENYEEFEPKFYLKNVDVFRTGEIGVDYDVLFDVVKEQTKNLTEKEIGQIMQHFEDNSNSPECDYVTIRPDKLMQCTGLKDKNDKLIYEGDVVKYICDSDWCADGYHQCIDCHSGENFKIYWNEYFCKFQYSTYDENEFNFDIDEDTEICLEVIGNIYENPELLEGKNE